MRAAHLREYAAGVTVELAVPVVPWLRERHWLALDALAAAALFALLVTGALTRVPTFGVPAWLPPAACVVTAVPVALRRLRPVTMLMPVLIGNTVLAVLGIGGNPAVAVAAVGYTVAVRYPPPRSLPPLALALVISLPAELAPMLANPDRPNWPAEASLLASSALVLAAAWTVGIAIRARGLYAVRSAEDRTRQAVAEERLRLARELHDVITHGMTVMTVKASVAGYLTESEPDEVRAALSVIETTGRTALTELRRMLGVLRADGPAAELTVAPGLADLPALIQQATAAGVTVDADVQPVELPDAISLSAYRIVQEALTNVIKHAAPAHCRITITAGADLHIDITDDGRSRPPGGDGHGILGMRERAALFDGHLTAKPLPGHGFRVTASLPLAGR